RAPRKNHPPTTPPARHPPLLPRETPPPPPKNQTNAATAPAMTGGPLIFSDDFGPVRGDKNWQITPEGDVYRNIENNAYHIRTTLPATAVTAGFFEEHQEGGGLPNQPPITHFAHSPPHFRPGHNFSCHDVPTQYV